MSRATAAAAALPPPAFPSSTCRAAATRSALRCRDESPSRFSFVITAQAGYDGEQYMMKSTPRHFTHIDTWVFDLDNTLYPHHVNLWQQVDKRIGEFVSAWLKVSGEEARVIQKDYYRRYGTTMRGMMTE